MKIQNNADLSKLTTVHIGGIAKELIIPESDYELLNVIKERKPKYYIGGGSNLLISDRAFDTVVSLREFNKNIVDKGDGQFLVGGSVRLQKLILEINNKGYGGIEFLFSVPGLLGGAVAMNAGGGQDQGFSISDYIVNVNCIIDGNIVSLDKKSCLFAFRDSLFKQNPSIIICSALLKFPKQLKELSEQRRKERLDFCREIHDLAYPNFGSVYRVYSPRIVHVVRLLQRNYTKGVHFSCITDNWLCNKGNGTFNQAMCQIKIVKFIHKLFFQKCIPEVIIWD